ncbi:unnamed protein product [Cylicocyclus nassatus]|uniref:Peptidase M13 N-terminal domain-containing protein n=1 Tax=Cylicocyclus nassatus TaxID=53992 RepID=A0AA36H7P0_CYLNA|nr:unnamed protein product [Cylicocyclus nassatus]
MSSWYLLFFIFIRHTTPKEICDKYNPPIGDTSDYKKLAQLFKERMYDKAHPCDNFYQFACGTYNVKATLKDVVRTKLAAKEKESIVGLLIAEEQVTPSKAFKITQRYYKSCLQSDEQWDDIGGPIQFVMRRIRDYGSFPLIDEEHSNDDGNYEVNLTDLLIYFNKNRTTTRLLVPIVVHRENDTAVLEFPPSEQRDRAFDVNKIKLVIALCVHTNSTCYLQNLLKDLFDVHALKQKIKSSIKPKENIWTVPMKLKQLNKSYSSVDWFKFLSEMTPSKVHYRYQDDTFMVKAPPIERMKKLDAVLKGAPRKVLANFIMVTYIESWLQWIDKPFETLAARAAVAGFFTFSTHICSCALHSSER